MGPCRRMDVDLSPGVETLSINLVARNKVDEYHAQEAGPSIQYDCLLIV